jgi:NAD(P)-dependent dehydrogenase (short-subunit alcohol dehydrogenase family)
VDRAERPRHQRQCSRRSLLFSLELAERLKATRVTANAAHPGVVRSQMLETAEGFFAVVAALARRAR